MKATDLYIYERSYYTGAPLETGGTSIQGNVSPAIAWISNSKLSPGKKVLDYGAGKYGRNAKYLRLMEWEVYAYDPFNGTDTDGWTGVSNKLPKGKFDIGFTSFVLNVVPEHIETKLIQDVSKRVKEAVFHITRNMDIFDTVKKALHREDPLVTKFFLEEFDPTGDLSDANILEFCYFGVQTSRGFQRIPELETKGFSLIKNTSGYKIYQS
tara:strand:+ start:921 stop:1553 length:633 start_codon:yes stop_codon:yes gene_type:complete